MFQKLKCREKNGQPFNSTPTNQFGHTQLLNQTTMFHHFCFTLHNHLLWSRSLSFLSLHFIPLLTSCKITKTFKFVCSVVVVGEAELDGTENKPRLLSLNKIKGVACGILAAYAVTSASFPVTAATQVQTSNSPENINTRSSLTSLSLYATICYIA